jgi:FtsH-binding integral membrane protein
MLVRSSLLVLVTGLQVGAAFATSFGNRFAFDALRVALLVTGLSVGLTAVIAAVAPPDPAPIGSPLGMEFLVLLCGSAVVLWIASTPAALHAWAVAGPALNEGALLVDLRRLGCRASDPAGLGVALVLDLFTVFLFALLSASSRR